MSRTYKDKSFKHMDPQVYDYTYGRERIECVVVRRYLNETEEYVSYRWLFKPGVKRKRKRTEHERHWMTTPMWWVREMMTVPQRAKGKMWERKVVKTSVEDLDLLDKPSVGRKPHNYYW